MRFKAPRSIRPTSAKVKEAIFSILLPLLPVGFEGVRCLDLFAGSGALGLSSLERGAAQLVAVDKSSESCRAISENANKFRLAERLLLKQQDALKFINSLSKKAPLSPDERFDLVFADPPYALAAEIAPELFAGLSCILSAEGVFVFECGAGFKLLEVIKLAEFDLELLKHKVYGDTQVFFISRLKSSD